MREHWPVGRRICVAKDVQLVEAERDAICRHAWESGTVVEAACRLSARRSCPDYGFRGIPPITSRASVHRLLHGRGFSGFRRRSPRPLWGMEKFDGRAWREHMSLSCKIVGGVSAQQTPTLLFAEERLISYLQPSIGCPPSAAKARPKPGEGIWIDACSVDP